MVPGHVSHSRAVSGGCEAVQLGGHLPGLYGGRSLALLSLFFFFLVHAPTKKVLIKGKGKKKKRQSNRTVFFPPIFPLQWAPDHGANRNAGFRPALPRPGSSSTEQLAQRHLRNPQAWAAAARQSRFRVVRRQFRGPWRLDNLVREQKEVDRRWSVVGQADAQQAQSREFLVPSLAPLPPPSRAQPHHHQLRQVCAHQGTWCLVAVTAGNTQTLSEVVRHCASRRQTFFLLCHPSSIHFSR